MTDPGDIIPFPTPPPADESAETDEQDQHDYSIVHRGRRYSGELLVGRLSAHCVRELSSIGSCTLQALWDEVVRRWPEIANDIVARVEASADRDG